MQNILVVDDDPSGVQLLITLLGLCGHEARKLEDWENPLGDIERYQPALVIMDVHLQSKNGLELLREIRTHPSSEVAQTPVLMISAEDYQAECKEAGASAFLLKPFGYGDLVAVISGIEEGNQP